MFQFLSIVVSILLSSSALFAGDGVKGAEIWVACGCTYDVDGIHNWNLVSGTRTEPTQEEIDSCIIEDGKVIDGCWAAKMNADFNCSQEAQWAMGSPITRFAMGMLEDQACYGKITFSE